MAQTSHEIRRQIEDTRSHLGTTIAALEHKIDPRRVVDEHPLTLLGVAFGTGVMLATTGATGRAVHEVKDQIRDGAHNINNRAGSALDGAINAVLGAAMTAITSRLSEAVEGALQGTDGVRREQRGTSRAA